MDNGHIDSQPLWCWCRTAHAQFNQCRPVGVPLLPASWLGLRCAAAGDSAAVLRISA